MPVSGEAVLVTTRRMTRVTIDSVRRIARVEAGVTWGQVVEAAAKVGLAPLAGFSPQGGVVGYSLVPVAELCAGFLQHSGEHARRRAPGRSSSSSGGPRCATTTCAPTARKCRRVTGRRSWPRCG
ncbi:MAG TPA: FAD-binding protein, partial [Asanoa sp.]|nr:FAD-binding protein [Asanoa sp.]